MKFNNAAQRVYGGVLRPVILTWQTNDTQAPWSAEARREHHDIDCLPANKLTLPPVIGDENNKSIVLKVGRADALKKKDAKGVAATSGYQWLVSQYPSIDLSDV
jgi:hypothetical protein